MLHATYAKLRYSTFIDFVILLGGLTSLYTCACCIHVCMCLCLCCVFASIIWLCYFSSLFRLVYSFQILIWFWTKQENIVCLSREMDTSLMASCLARFASINNLFDAFGDYSMFQRNGTQVRATLFTRKIPTLPSLPPWINALSKNVFIASNI